MNNLRATISKEAHENARMPNGKEQTGCAEVVTVHKGEIINPITARFFMGRSSGASVVYCCIWIRTASGRYLSGRGNAGGYGYHKASAALDDAIHSAGVSLYGYPYSGLDRDGKPDIAAMIRERKPASISGVGETAMRSALEAIARAAGYRGKLRLLGV